MNAKKWFAAAVLATLILPFFIYSWSNYFRSLKRPEDMVYVTPAEFETAFNERMEPYGLSINLKNAYWGTLGERRTVAKTVPVDGAAVTLYLVASGTGARDFVGGVQFDQTPAAGERVWMPELLELLLQIFQPSLAGDRDYCSEESWDLPAVSWNGAMDACRAFAADDAQESLQFVVATKRKEVPNSDRYGGYERVAFPQKFYLERKGEGAQTLSLVLAVFVS